MTGEGGGIISLFRAVGLAELADIQRTGAFNPGVGVMETKLFATSAEDAARFGELLYTHHRQEFAVVEALLPVALADDLDRFLADTMISVAVYPEQLARFNGAVRIRLQAAPPQEHRDAWRHRVRGTDHLPIAGARRAAWGDLLGVSRPVLLRAARPGGGATVQRLHHRAHRS